MVGQASHSLYMGSYCCPLHAQPHCRDSTAQHDANTRCCLAHLQPGIVLLGATGEGAGPPAPLPPAAASGASWLRHVLALGPSCGMLACEPATTPPAMRRLFWCANTMSTLIFWPGATAGSRCAGMGARGESAPVLTPLLPATGALEGPEALGAPACTTNALTEMPVLLSPPCVSARSDHMELTPLSAAAAASPMRPDLRLYVVTRASTSDVWRWRTRVSARSTSTNTPGTTMAGVSQRDSGSPLLRSYRMAPVMMPAQPTPNVTRPAHACSEFQMLRCGAPRSGRPRCATTTCSPDSPVSTSASQWCACCSLGLPVMSPDLGNLTYAMAKPAALHATHAHATHTCSWNHSAVSLMYCSPYSQRWRASRMNSGARPAHATSSSTACALM
mmetsp:Transcript_36007/g.90960  ORF Transcript_36007/g.90960 Transcript_36007/m.90960 type:complete len:389 (-) Transcript_36007:651-1817(-)